MSETNTYLTSKKPYMHASKEEFDEAAAKWRRNSQNETPGGDEVAVDLNAD